MDLTRIGIHLLIVCTCIIGACARLPGRGRIVARIRSDQFVIPAHLQRNALDIRTGQPYASAEPVCSDQCPPPWMGMLKNIAPNISQPVCRIAHEFTPCMPGGNPCQMSRSVPFTCCPAQCMPDVVNCFTQKPSDYLCIPRSFQPWIPTMFSP
ncbi:hypothetical protein ACF0H5_020762 [Mactra antiquata]